MAYLLGTFFIVEYIDPKLNIIITPDRIRHEPMAKYSHYRNIKYRKWWSTREWREVSLNHKRSAVAIIY